MLSSSSMNIRAVHMWRGISCLHCPTAVCHVNATFFGRLVHTCFGPAKGLIITFPLSPTATHEAHMPKNGLRRVTQNHLSHLMHGERKVVCTNDCTPSWHFARIQPTNDNGPGYVSVKPVVDTIPVQNFRSRGIHKARACRSDKRKLC